MADTSGEGGAASAPGHSPIVIATIMAGTVPAERGVTGPFRQLDSDAPAEIELRQVDTDHFALLTGFRYVGAAGSWTVTPLDLPRTDLATVPRFLGWFVGTYGRHTFAALLHDHLIHNGETLHPPASRRTADEAFRTALIELGVPYLRTRIMWSAVSFVTRWHGSFAGRLGVLAWSVAALAGVVSLVMAVATSQPAVAAAALIAPLAFALLWGPSYRAGVFGAYSLWLVAVPSLVTFVVYGIYWAAELGLRRVRLLLPSSRPRHLPGPPPYSAR